MSSILCCKIFTSFVSIEEQQSAYALSLMMLDRSQNLELCRLVIVKSLSKQHDAFQLQYWRSIIDFIEIFDDPDACIDHMSGIIDESIFLIIDADLYEKTVSRIHKLRQIYRIYIFNERNDTADKTTEEK
jgi:hypothetical protein